MGLNVGDEGEGRKRRAGARRARGKRESGRRGDVGEDATGPSGGSAASAGAADDQQAGDLELQPAMGKIHDHGGESDSPGVPYGGEPDGGGKSERAAKRRVSAESDGIRAEAGNPSKGRR